MKMQNKPVGRGWVNWKTNHGKPAFRRLYAALSVVTCLSFACVLLFMVSALPPFGDPGNPAFNEVPRKYIEEGVQDTGALNIVAGMILDYRAFDTFAEACVLFTAAAAVLILLRSDGPLSAFDSLIQEMEDPRPNVILMQTASLLVPIILLFGCYVILNGHLSPGGGFSGGAILGAALILYASAYGTKRARRFIHYNVLRRTIALCLYFYALAKGYAFYAGANGLDAGIPKGTPGALFSAGLIPLLNIAVGLAVACVVYLFYILFSTGEFR